MYKFFSSVMLGVLQWYAMSDYTLLVDGGKAMCIVKSLINYSFKTSVVAEWLT